MHFYRKLDLSLMKTILTRIKIQHISNTEEKSMCSSLRVQIYTMQINGYDWLPHQTTSDCTGPTSDQRRAMFFENWLQPVVLTPSDPWGAILTLSDPRGMVLTLKPGRQESRHWPIPVTNRRQGRQRYFRLCRWFVTGLSEVDCRQLIRLCPPCRGRHCRQTWTRST